MHPLSRIMTITVLVGMVLGFASTSSAQIPNTISYQGILANTATPPVVVPDGNYTLGFKLYTTSSGGLPFWGETHNNVPVSEGRFYVELGSVFSLAGQLFDAPYFLGITVNGGTELPRIPLTASAYSLNARRVATVDGAMGGGIGGNIDLQASTPTTGNISKGGDLFIHDIGTENTFIGRNAGNLTMTGSWNTGCGMGALSSSTSGYSNAANGQHALWKNTIGSENTASGASALASNISGNRNAAHGVAALASNSTGDDNTATGNRALTLNTQGSSNTALGSNALSKNTTGSSSTAIGAEALSSGTTGAGNTAIGMFALKNVTDGGLNTAVGKYALYSDSNGNFNTAIGAGAGVASTSLTNTTAIGYGAIVYQSNKIRLGNADVTAIEGQVAYTFTSDKNQKENFRAVDGDEVLRKIRRLDLSSWNYKGQDARQFRHYGPVAQEFYDAFGHDDVGTSGTPTTINSGDEAGILMIAIQTLEKRTAEVEVLKAQVAELREMIRAQASKQK